MTFGMRGWRREVGWVFVAGSAALFAGFGHGWERNLGSPGWVGFVLLWLFAAMFTAAFSVARHAESLALRLGEPLGTLVLTLSVTFIEVALISAVMLGADKPGLARDAMFAVVMTVNGMIGLCLLLGGLRHREQEVNLQGANSFLSLILPLTVIGLILPNFTRATEGPTLSAFQSAFVAIISLAIYAVFLLFQTRVHPEYFKMPEETDEHGHPMPRRPTWVYGMMLVLYLLPFVFLSEQLAEPLDRGLQLVQAPPDLAGFLIALIILSPESMTAVRAARANHVQRSVNVLLGSVLASLSLTIPAVITVGLWTSKPVLLGLDAVDTILLLVTLGVSTLTFSTPRTNVLQGAVHLLLFLAYGMLLFQR